MDNKDKILLEQAYQKILENRYASQNPEEYDEDEDEVKEIKKEENRRKYENQERHPADDGSDNWYVDEDEEDEDLVEDSYKIPHGIQSISEAKKKVNPWAIEKSIEKKTGKKFGKKHKEEIIKGIKKSAKKAGKKITSDKVK